MVGAGLSRRRSRRRNRHSTVRRVVVVTSPRRRRGARVRRRTHSTTPRTEHSQRRSSHARRGHPPTVTAPRLCRGWRWWCVARVVVVVVVVAFARVAFAEPGALPRARPRVVRRGDGPPRLSPHGARRRRGRRVDEGHRGARSRNLSISQSPDLESAWDARIASLHTTAMIKCH